MTPCRKQTRQPPWQPWSMQQLRHEHAIAIGCSIETSTAKTYSSALESYITFCSNHDLPPEPTPDTLSFYVVYMAHHIKPQSVDNYLSGICNQLEAFHPNICTIQQHHLIMKTLAGCKKLRVVGTNRK